LPSFRWSRSPPHPRRNTKAKISGFSHLSSLDRSDVAGRQLAPGNRNPNNREAKDLGMRKFLLLLKHFCLALITDCQIECLNSINNWQLQEFDDCFNEVNSELIGHMASFSPNDSFVAFDSESLVELAKFYPDDFDSKNLDDLGHELITYIDNMRGDERFAHLDGIADLGKLMVHTNKHSTFLLVFQTSEASINIASCHGIS
jgi:hypothetical protein